MKLKTPLILIQLFNFEFWPFWIFYAPMFLYGLILALRARSATYFTATNPGMKYGGAFDLDKLELLRKINQKYIPKTIIIPLNTHISKVTEQLNSNNFEFPLIAKPNIGERGINVEKINNIETLQKHLKKQRYDTLIQEFIDYELELGVFYHRYPNDLKDGITSVAQKEFLTITGDGENTFGELLSNNTRARFRLNYLKEKYSKQWNQTLPKGKSVRAEPIGSHNRGTKFFNKNYLINSELIKTFREIAQHIDGFYFGRFDLKIEKIQDLYTGKNIKIMELNGVNSEPAHIYDSKINIIQAYASIIRHMNIAYKISCQNREKGAATTPFFQTFSALVRHVFP